ncbi:MAG: transcriptional regulator [Hoeflea sp.]|uniref:helix-turn-helix domain-containing protein n=1 Tax=Hoeflea sp. TaxID=1940281 RepID=UPI0027309B97|nr:transcriptional regulator [Hoeflea sp.]MDP2118873.1 transcriptional regulator [Hoeflea sp.]MDP3524326.1 transcriptional regulator [Hoeflea sp.]
MTIRPIKTEKDHAQALKRIEALMTARADTPEGDELDVLVTLVEAYEAKHYAIDAPDPIAAIHHRMEAMGMARKDLEPLLGSKSRVSEVLNRKRKLTMEMVRNLHEGMQLPAEALIQDYTLRV